MFAKQSRMLLCNKKKYGPKVDDDDGDEDGKLFNVLSTLS